MPVNSLVLCRDPEIVPVLRRALEELEISIDLSATSGHALHAITNRKFDAVIVDCDDIEGAPEVLKQLRQGASNRSAIVFAIINKNTTVRTAFEMGANFVLEKPISADRALRSFHAAYGLILRERHRYLRHPVEIPVTILLNNGSEFAATILNVSEGGLAIKLDRDIPSAPTLRVFFVLPDSERMIEAKTEIAWIGEDGRIGLRFIFMAQLARHELDIWLSKLVKKQEVPKKTTRGSRVR